MFILDNSWLLEIFQFDFSFIDLGWWSTERGGEVWKGGGCGVRKGVVEHGSFRNSIGTNWCVLYKVMAYDITIPFSTYYSNTHICLYHLYILTSLYGFFGSHVTTTWASSHIVSATIEVRIIVITCCWSSDTRVCIRTWAMIVWSHIAGITRR